MDKLNEYDFSFLEKAILKSIYFDPSNSSYFYQLAKLYESKYRQSARKNPDSDVIYLEKALKNYQKAIESEPTNSRYHQSVGFLYAELIDEPEISEKVITLINSPIPLEELFPSDESSNLNQFFKLSYSHLRFAVQLDRSNPYRHRALAIACFHLSRIAREDNNGNISKRLKTIGIAEYKRVITDLPTITFKNDKSISTVEEALNYFYAYVSRNEEDLVKLLPDSINNRKEVVQRFLSQKKL